MINEAKKVYDRQILKKQRKKMNIVKYPMLMHILYIYSWIQDTIFIV